MWVMTTGTTGEGGGFYSAIRKPDMPQDQIMVRARRHDDLERLLRAIKSDAKVISTPRGDYAYRVIIPVKAWAQYLHDCAMDIDYSNFKDAACSGDLVRHEAYMECWAALLKLQWEL